MEEYRNKLKIQNVFFSVCSAVLIAVQILAHSGVIDPVNSGKSWADFWNGFIAGVALGVTAIMIFGLIKNLIALKNNKQLKKLYVKENDERKKEICTKGKSAGATAYLCCMIAAAIICGYFNVIVCITCIICTFVQSLFMVGGKLYYNRKL